MKLVLDTNVVLKALIKNSVVGGILLSPNHEFFVPEHLFEEVRNHRAEVVDKSGLSEEEVDSVLDALLTNIGVIPSDKILSKWKAAERAIGQVDRDDIPFVAAALSVDCELWSDDGHLKRQNKVKVRTTKDVVRTGTRP